MTKLAIFGGINLMIMVAIALSVLALAAGVYLLVKVKSEFLSNAFGLLAWLVIVLSLISFGFAITKGLNRGENCHKQCSYQSGAACPGKSAACDKPCGNTNNGACVGKCGGKCEGQCKTPKTCGAGCTMEGDSCVMDKAVCEQQIGAEACAKLIAERGRCIMSKEECAKSCKNPSCAAVDGEAKKECCKKK